jgi:hypothetical protein
MSVRSRIAGSLGWLAAALSLAAPAAAQDFSYGVKGGLNLSNISFDAEGSSVSNGTRAGLAIGGYVESWLRMEGWSVLTEALISQKGSKIETDDVDRSLRLTYLEVPVLLRAAVAAPRNTPLHLYIGPAFALELSESRVEDESGEPAIKEDFFKPFDVSITFGGSFMVRKATIDLRYSVGIANIADEDDFEPGVTARNRTFSILVGWPLR